MRYIIATAVVIALAGCSPPGRYTPPAEVVTVVAVQCEKRGGTDDCVTTVQFPDSLRFQRNGRWGHVGDVFKAYRPGPHWYWTSEAP